VFCGVDPRSGPLACCSASRPTGMLLRQTISRTYVVCTRARRAALPPAIWTHIDFTIDFSASGVLVQLAALQRRRIAFWSFGNARVVQTSVVREELSFIPARPSPRACAPTAPDSPPGEWLRQIQAPQRGGTAGFGRRTWFRCAGLVWGWVGSCPAAAANCRQHPSVAATPCIGSVLSKRVAPSSRALSAFGGLLSARERGTGCAGDANRAGRGHGAATRPLWAGTGFEKMVGWLFSAEPGRLAQLAGQLGTAQAPDPCRSHDPSMSAAGWGRTRTVIAPGPLPRR